MFKKPYALHEINGLKDDIIEFLNSGPMTTCIYLTNRAKSCDTSQNRIFQRVFIRYYGLNGAGVTPKFVSAFFGELERAKIQGFKPDVIANNLKDIPNRKGQKSLQFSFITKIGATLDPHLPIYDSRIIDLLGLPNRKTIRDYEDRLGSYLEDYERLKVMLPNIGREKPITDINEQIKDMDPAVSLLPIERTCDLILWAYHQLSSKNSEIEEIANQAV